MRPDGISGAAAGIRAEKGMDGTYGAKRRLLILMTSSSDLDRGRGLGRVFYYKNYPAAPGRGIGSGERRGGRL